MDPGGDEARDVRDVGHDHRAALVGGPAHGDEVDGLMGSWFAEHSAADAQRILDAAGAPVSPIYSIADIFADPHYLARSDIVSPEDPTIGAVPMPAVTPRFSRTPGSVRFVGPELGAHNADIYGGLLGLSPDEQASLREDGVI